MKLLIKNVHAVDIGLDTITDILIVDGHIVRMGRDIVELCDGDGDRVIDATGLTAMPGLFDMHVHFRDPGQTQKEDILTVPASVATTATFSDLAPSVLAKATTDAIAATAERIKFRAFIVPLLPELSDFSDPILPKKGPPRHHPLE